MLVYLVSAFILCCYVIFVLHMKCIIYATFFYIYATLFLFSILTYVVLLMLFFFSVNHQISPELNNYSDLTINVILATLTVNY